MYRRCKAGRELAAVSREVKDREDGMLGSLGLVLPTSTVGSQRLCGTGEGEGTGYGEKAGLFRKELPWRSWGLGVLCQHGVHPLHSLQLPGDSVPAAAEAFLCSFIIQHILTA